MYTQQEFLKTLPYICSTKTLTEVKITFKIIISKMTLKNRTHKKTAGGIIGRI